METRLNCRSCGQEIHFDNSIKSNTGKSIPLQGATGYDKHDCPNNPYKKNQAKQEFANVANQAVNSSFTDKPALERIETELKRLTELLEAVLINQGLYKPASDLE